jgi:hypothetical protein
MWLHRHFPRNDELHVAAAGLCSKRRRRLERKVEGCGGGRRRHKRRGTSLFVCLRYVSKQGSGLRVAKRAWQGTSERGGGEAVGRINSGEQRSGMQWKRMPQSYCSRTGIRVSDVRESENVSPHISSLSRGTGSRGESAVRSSRRRHSGVKPPGHHPTRTTGAGLSTRSC